MYFINAFRIIVDGDGGGVGGGGGDSSEKYTMRNKKLLRNFQG